MDFTKVIEKFLSEEADKAKVQEVLEAAAEEYTQSKIEGLLKNNKELKDEKTAIKQQFEEISQKYNVFAEADLTIDKFNEVQKELSDIKAATAGIENLDDFKEKLQEQYKRGKQERDAELNPKINSYENQLAEIKAEREKLNKRYVEYRALDQVRKTIDRMKLNVDPYWLKGIMAEADITYDSESDKVNVALPSKGNLLPLSDWEDNFPTSPEGKRLLAARANAGGGAAGSSASQTNYTLEDIAKIDDPEKMEKALKDAGYL